MTACRSADPAIPPRLPHAADPANAETSARSSPAAPPPPPGSAPRPPVVPTAPQTASSGSPAAFLPVPSRPPLWSSSRTGHITCYKIRTHHELTTTVVAVTGQNAALALHLCRHSAVRGRLHVADENKLARDTAKQHLDAIEEALAAV